jgi:hypothetical protein
MTRDKYAKLLRQKIMATASVNGWNYEEFHAYVEDWGYGNSLRKLRIGELKEVLAILRGGKSQKKDYGPGKLEGQGLYMWSLMKSAGWTWPRVQKLILKKYKATHWNALDEKQQRGVINILKRYSNDN